MGVKPNHLPPLGTIPAIFDIMINNSLLRAIILILAVNALIVCWPKWAQAKEGRTRTETFCAWILGKLPLPEALRPENAGPRTIKPVIDGMWPSYLKSPESIGKWSAEREGREYHRKIIDVWHSDGIVKQEVLLMEDFPKADQELILELIMSSKGQPLSELQVKEREENQKYLMEQSELLLRYGLTQQDIDQVQLLTRDDIESAAWRLHGANRRSTDRVTSGRTDSVLVPDWKASAIRAAKQLRQPLRLMRFFHVHPDGVHPLSEDDFANTKILHEVGKINVPIHTYAITQDSSGGIIIFHLGY